MLGYLMKAEVIGCITDYKFVSLLLCYLLTAGALTYEQMSITD